MGLGVKDVNPSLFKVWDEIFQSQTSKIIKMGNNFKFDEYGKPRGSFWNIFNSTL